MGSHWFTGLRTAHDRAGASLQHGTSADLDDWLSEETGAAFAPVSRLNGWRPDALLGLADAEEVRLSVSTSEQPSFAQHIMPRIWPHKCAATQSLPDFGLELEDAASPSPQRSIEGARTVSRCRVQSNLPDDRRYDCRDELFT